VALLGGCVGVVRVHDDRVTLSEDEFRGRVASQVAVGASENDVTAFLNSLETSDRSDHAVIKHYPAEVVAQDWCLPRPCSLVDGGVSPGVIEITARVWNFDE